MISHICLLNKIRSEQLSIEGRAEKKVWFQRWQHFSVQILMSMILANYWCFNSALPRGWQRHDLGGVCRIPVLLFLFKNLQTSLYFLSLYQCEKRSNILISSWHLWWGVQGANPAPCQLTLQGWATVSSQPGWIYSNGMTTGGSMDSEVSAPRWEPPPAQLGHGCVSYLIPQPFPQATLTTTTKLPIPMFFNAWGSVIRQWWLCKGVEDLFWGSRSDLSESVLDLCVCLPQQSPRMGWHFSASCLHCSPDSRRSIFKQKCRLHCNHPTLRKQTFLPQCKTKHLLKI